VHRRRLLSRVVCVIVAIAAAVMLAPAAAAKQGQLRTFKYVTEYTGTYSFVDNYVGDPSAGEGTIKTSAHFEWDARDEDLFEPAGGNSFHETVTEWVSAGG
jgi:hypothetical protein